MRERRGDHMEAAIRLRGMVKPGGRLELADSNLPVGESVDVIVIVPESPDPDRLSVTEVLASAPGGLAFRTAEEVDAYVRAERDSWEH
jgi:hypothetical protein